MHRLQETFEVILVRHVPLIIVLAFTHPCITLNKDRRWNEFHATRQRLLWCRQILTCSEIGLVILRA